MFWVSVVSGLCDLNIGKNNSKNNKKLENARFRHTRFWRTLEIAYQICESCVTLALHNGRKTRIYVVISFSPPPPGDKNVQKDNFFQYLGPSVHKTGPIDSISYTMIVSGLLHPFLAILDFFDSYHALATLCKLENHRNLAF